MSLENLHILVVDDLPGTRRLMHDVLVSLGVGTVELMPDGEAAWSAIKQNPPDVLVADWEMAPLDGIALTRRVRDVEKSPNPYMPVIMMTAHTALERVREARDAGATEFLAKPITTRSIAGRLTEVIERPRPFVRAKDFFGPDRRRRPDPAYAGRRRRAADIKPLSVVPPSAPPPPASSDPGDLVEL